MTFAKECPVCKQSIDKTWGEFAMLTKMITQMKLIFVGNVQKK